MSNLKVIIPARSGSKRIKSKNILKIRNRSLLQHAVDFSLSLESDQIIISSDSENYFESLEISNQIVFHKRSEYASSDSATDFDIVFNIYKDNLLEDDDTLIWIRPTSPLRKPEDCINAVNIFNNQTRFYSLRSIQEVSDHPYWMKFVSEDGTLFPIIDGKNESNYPNSQSLPKCYFPTCEFEIAKLRNVLMQKKLICSPSTFFITKDSAVDIDTMKDFQYAKFLMEH